MKLYSYFRSSAAYRVRIALNLKELEYDQIPVNLLTSEQKSKEYRDINPEGLVPCLDTENGILTQSLAILEWLEESYPDNPILPGNSWQKAQIRSIAYAISCDVHPINNLRILKYLQGEMSQKDEAKIQWIHHWVSQGFDALEKQLDDSLFCCAGEPTLADICLVPQVFNALRFKVSMDAYPKIEAIYNHCNSLPAFRQAAPEMQPDAA